MRWCLWLCLVCFVLLSVQASFAHSMYQSSVLIDVHGSSLDVELQLPPSKLGAAIGRPIPDKASASMAPELLRYIEPRFAILDGSGHPWAIVGSPTLEWQVIEGAPYVVLHERVVPPPGAELRRFVVSDRVITDKLPSHAALVSIRSDWKGNTFANEPDFLGVLTGEVSSLPVELEQGSWTRGFSGVFRLGLRHIAEGTDHLLFLLALLLPAPLSCVRKSWSKPVGVQQSLLRIVRIATAFTIGHSLTLALASFGLVRVPEKPIEGLIAFSILISAVHAIRPIFPGKEALVAAFFGLIHGLAFATTLAALGLHGWERAESLLAFNLGIESMQLVVIAAILPSLLLLSRTKSYSGFRIVGASFAGLASAGWVVERVSGQDLSIDSGVNVLANHAVILACLLLVWSVIAYLVSRPERITIDRD